MNADVIEILLLGNDKHINKLNTKNVDKTSLLTAGVNRIWYKYKPDILYFMDWQIPKEIIKANAKFEKTSFMYPPRYLEMIINNHELLNSFDEFIGEHDSSCFACPMPTGGGRNSATWLIRTLNDTIFKNKKVKFYLYGISLQWDETSHHFWDGDKRSTNDKGKEYYNKMFDIYYNSFDKLSSDGNYEIYSCTPESRLNDMFEYIDIAEVLNDFSI